MTNPERPDRPEAADGMEGLVSRSLSRRKFVAGAASMTSLAVLLAACGDEDDGDSTSAAPPTSAAAPASSAAPATSEAPATSGRPRRPPSRRRRRRSRARRRPPSSRSSRASRPACTAARSASTGAERYQYPLDSEEGRAIEGLRKLRQDGKAPDKLIVQVLDFAQPQFEKGFPPGAQSHLELFKEETGISIEFVVTSPADEYSENLRNASTQNGSFDLVTSAIEEVGDFAEAGLLLPLDEFVAKYQPQWADPEWGYLGGEATVALFNQYKGSTYTVAFDNDTQPYFYRSDLFTNPDEMAAFEDKYGRPLTFPETWEQQAEVAEFFTRPDADTPLFGDVSTLAPFWCAVNWNQRFVCSANPNMMYFNEDASANVEQRGRRPRVRRAAQVGRVARAGLPRAHLDRAVRRHGRRQRLRRARRSRTRRRSCRATRTWTRPTSGQFIRSDVMPGRVIDGALIRRPVIFYNICYGVNAFVGPVAPRGRVPVPAVGRRRAHLHVADRQPGRLPGSAPHLLVQRPVRAGELQAGAARGVQRDRAAHGAADHPQGRRCLPRLALARRSRRS